MSKYLYTNNAATTLAAGIGAGDLTLTVATGTGALFPNPTGSEHFMATLVDGSSNFEIVSVTSRATDTFSIIRAQEGTVARAFSLGDKLELRVTAGGLGNNLQVENIGVSVQAYDADTAKTDVAQTFTAVQRTNETTDNDGSFDMNAALDFVCTPGAGFALTFTNIPATPLVQKGTIVLVNGSNYAITAHANTKVEATTLAKISATGTYELFYRSSNGVVYVTASGALA